MADFPADAVVHFGFNANAAICVPAKRGERAEYLTFDTDDQRINCPYCQMYLKGLRHGRRGV